MKPFFLPTLAGLLLTTTLAQAEDLNLNNTPETTYVALSPYSFGVGVGAMTAINPELRDESAAHIRLSFAQSIRFQENLDLGLDVDWWGPGGNWGGTLFLDYVFGKGALQPLIGLGAGIHNWDYYDKFGEGFGTAFTAHAGIMMDVTDELQLRVRVPYHLTFNANQDMSAGLDIALLISSPHRKTNVKKLKY
jgi:hypothetical protein